MGDACRKRWGGDPRTAWDQPYVCFLPKVVVGGMNRFAQSSITSMAQHMRSREPLAIRVRCFGSLQSKLLGDEPNQ